MKKMVVVLIVGILLTGRTDGAVFSRNDVPAEAQWVVHIDMENYSASDTARLIEEAISEIQQKSGRTDEGLCSMKETLGIDPMTDIKSMTVFGDQFLPGEGTAIFKGRLNQDQVLARVSREASYQETAYGSRWIYTWGGEEGRRPHALCFFTPDTAMLARNSESLQTVIDVMNGNKPSLADAPAGLQVPDSAEGVFFLACANQCQGRLKSGRPNMALMEKVDKMAFAVAETDGSLHLEMQIESATPEDAVLINDTVTGMLSFMALGAENNPAAANLARKIRVQQRGAVVAAGLSCTPQDMLAFMQAQRAMREARRQRIQAWRQQMETARQADEAPAEGSADRAF